MKFTVALLVGIATAQDRPVWTLQSVQDHRTDARLQDTYGQHSIKQADARPPYRSHAEIQSDSDSDSSDDDDDSLQQLDLMDDVDHSGEFFKATESGQLHGGGYERVTTARFASDSDDIFMRSMIEQYALEGKNKDGSPNGAFWMDEAGARAAASEVLHTHKGLTGKARDDYLKTYFPRTWAHFDVNRSGKIEVIKMPQFMRFLCSDQRMYLW